MTSPLRRRARRLRSAVTATTAGGVLLLGSPVLTGVPTAAAATPASASTAAAGPALVAAERHRWPGHPGRSIRLHRVRPGETVTGLATRFHAWTRELSAINHLGASGRLLVGQRIRIPVVVAAVRRAAEQRRHVARAHHRSQHRTRTHRSPSAGRRHHPGHHSRKPWRHAHATRAQVRRVIVRTARRHGVGARVALAISWQESGWQQRRRSSAGAVGAMQVMPDTGRWMSLYAHRRLNLYGLYDNVTAGVLLFKVLRTTVRWKRSIAAYYQGLGALRQHGMYPSTRRYTRNVTALYRRLSHGWDPS